MYQFRAELAATWTFGGMLRGWETVIKEEGSAKLTDIPPLDIHNKLTAVFS